MRYLKLRRLKKNLYFTVEDVASILNIKQSSARVMCSRYAKNGFFIRLKNNFYILSENWDKFSREYFLRISNYLQVPSYISYMTALMKYGVTTQVQQNFFESCSLKRTKVFNVKGIEFKYYKIRKDYYFGFERKDNIFLATKEKAFIDALYLYCFGKYRIDFSSLDLNKLDKKKIIEIIGVFPSRTRKIVRKICKI
ncbi:hypothetical protein ES707_16605 [subsurface metagenome]